ncbi:MAG: carboxylesterase [Lysobacterales bacterium 69-70]|nr:dienelactone hydrolase family protein [Xanthomonadaceae bacterium]ODU34315.1 MAG: carboxylesterase [Xanthomonadaceae bacterium SCN 69-320]ODV22424.1 MAG: carboxylesterase [Xanthomonadaceae bacterium SCN 69-25]OJY96221.1 MAG: carboxylesterase [Xanthomonadales bacterium 69-70]
MILPAVEITTRPRPSHSVIWLHGLGADGHDFAPIIPELVAPEWPALRFVFPHAPLRPVTINGGAAMRAWYDIKGTDIASRQDEAGVRESMTQLDALIAREADRGVPAERVFLAGFSQGGAIVLAGGVRHARRLGGVVALSTYLPIDATTAAERSPANADLPVFMAHGSHDPVVPQPLGARSRDILRGLGYRVDWHSYPMAHSVCAEEIADLRQWLGLRLAA